MKDARSVLIRHTNSTLHLVPSKKQREGAPRNELLDGESHYTAVSVV